VLNVEKVLYLLKVASKNRKEKVMRNILLERLRDKEGWSDFAQNLIDGKIFSSIGLYYGNIHSNLNIFRYRLGECNI